MFAIIALVLSLILHPFLATEFDRREVMRWCRCIKTSAEIQPVLDFLEDYGYIRQQSVLFQGFGRPPLPTYTVNPELLSASCPLVRELSGKDADSKMQAT